MTPDRDARALFWAMAGWLVWSSAFVGVYGLHALGCAYGWQEARIGPTSGLFLGLLAMAGVHVGALALLLARAARKRRAERDGDAEGFVAALAVPLTAAALVATVWSAAPVAAYPLCA